MYVVQNVSWRTVVSLKLESERGRQRRYFLVVAAKNGPQMR